MPMPRASPPSEIRLSVVPLRNMGRKVARMDSGMAATTSTVARRLPRNKNSTATASAPPSTAVRRTSPRAASMKRDWS